jgi:RNA polymerase sigma-70 factor (ECF subfamily)
MAQASDTLEQVFRSEYGRIIATLIHTSGSFDLAEEALQEAFTSAASSWARDGVPKNPGAWLTTVAHRKLLDADRIRKESITAVRRACAGRGNRHRISG